MIISPSILASDFLNLESEIKKLNELENIWLHLDIMDGDFVPNLTFAMKLLKKFVTSVKTHATLTLWLQTQSFI